MNLHYPFDLYCDLSDNLLEMLHRDELDLCLCNSESGESGGQFLCNEPVVWIAPEDAEIAEEFRSMPPAA